MEKKIELLSFSAGADCTTLAIVGNAVSAEVPVRIQRSRKHKQVSPNGLPIVYVGRGSRWGNPFRLVKYSDGKWAITWLRLAQWRTSER